MILRAFSILDTKTEAFGVPFFERTTASGERLFARLAQDPDSMIYRHPADFVLFEIGDFSQENGTLTPVPKPRNLGTAAQYMAEATDSIARSTRSTA